MTHKQGVTNDDIMAMLSQFSNTMEERFDGLETDMGVLKADVSTLKSDVSVLKSDVSILRKDVDELRSDVRVLQTDMREVKQSLTSLDGRVQALEADVREIYLMLAKRDSGDAKFSKLSLEKKLLQLNANLLATAKEAGIVLPR